MSTVCGKCQRTLKNPKSMERGYGPLCWGKVSKDRKADDDRNQAMRSDFTYHTREINGTSVLVIIDLDQGGMSVTNNVEAVVKSIAAELGPVVYRMPIIYKDSMGIYDGIDGSNLASPFYSIGETDEVRAATKAAEKARR